MRRHDYQDRTVLKFGADHGEPLTDDDIKEVCHDLKHRHATTQAAITGTIVTNRHELDVVCEDWGLNHPTFRAADGSRMFLSGDEDADGLRLLFKESYGDAYAANRGYKYPVESVELDVHWHRTPDCPVCGDDMVYGMMDWSPSQRDDGFMSGWMCNECLPRGVTVNEGLR